MRKAPPKKKQDQAKGPRKIGGEILGVRELAESLGVPQHMIRARVARRQIPYKRWGGRIIFLRSEMTRYLEELEGVSVEEALSNERARRGEAAQI